MFDMLCDFGGDGLVIASVASNALYDKILSFKAPSL